MSALCLADRLPLDTSEVTTVPDPRFDPNNIKKLTTADLADGLFGSIQAMIERGKPENIVFHYFLPGIPFGPELASFMDLGLTPTPINNTDANGQVRFTANDVMRSAVNFGVVVDYIPAQGAMVTSTVNGDGEVTVDLNALVSSGKRISQAYESVLNNCKVIDNSLSDADQEKLLKLEGLLYKEPKVEVSENPETATAVHGPEELDLDALLGDGMDTGDLVTDPSQLREPTPRMQAYEATRVAFQKVQDEELEARRKISRDDPNAGEILAASNRKIEAALKRWEILGKKVETEAIMAKIAQLSQGGLPTYVANLKTRLEANRIRAAVFTTDAGAAPLVEEAYYTALRPNGILRAPGMKFSLNSSESHLWSSMSSKSTAVKAGFFGGPLFAAKGAKSSSDVERKFFQEGFSISFEIVQGIVDRPWLDLTFLESDAFTTVDPVTKKPLDEVSEIVELSDGQRPPSGALPLVPVTVYFVRNVNLKSNAFLSLSKEEKDSLSGKAGVSFLGFGSSGKHSADTTRVDTSRVSTAGEMELEGTFLVAVASRLLEKSPNPDFKSHPDAQDWI
jgi:hypothetical protein